MIHGSAVEVLASWLLLGMRGPHKTEDGEGSVLLQESGHQLAGVLLLQVLEEIFSVPPASGMATWQ